MNYNPREMDDPTYGRQYGTRFTDPMDRERRNGGYGRDAMDSRNQQQGRENRQWGADRYESNPYGNRHIDDRGSEDRDRYTQDSTNRNAWSSGPTWNSSSNWSHNAESSYWPDRNDFQNREYNFRDYTSENLDDSRSARRREYNDRDFGRSRSPDHGQGYENQNRQRFGEVFGRNDQRGYGSQGWRYSGGSQSGDTSSGTQNWSERYQNRHFASGDRSQMSGRNQAVNDRAFVNNRVPSAQQHPGGLEYGRSSGRDLGGGFNRSYLERGYNDYGSDYRTGDRDSGHFHESVGTPDQRIYDHGQFMSGSQYEHDRDTYGSIPGFGSTGHHFGKGPKGYKRADARIQEEVSDALYHDPHIDASEIEVAVKDGVVTLSGSVPERRMKRLAEDCAERISGVHDVRNQISGGGFFSRLFEGDKSASSSSASSVSTSGNLGSSTTNKATAGKDKSDKSSPSSPNMM